MKNNTINIVLITSIVIIFFGYFTLLNMNFENNNIMERLKLVENYARNEEWDKVIKETKSLKSTWESQKHLLMFNFSEAEFAVLENHLDYIIGGAEGEQRDTTIGNILAVQDQWENAKKIVPEP